MKYTVCSLCKSPFHNIIHGKKLLWWGISPLKREFVSEGNMKEETEFLAKIDRRFNQELKGGAKKMRRAYWIGINHIIIQLSANN